MSLLLVVLIVLLMALAFAAVGGLLVSLWEDLLGSSGAVGEEYAQSATPQMR